jgi:hypothetical protein
MPPIIKPRGALTTTIRDLQRRLATLNPASSPNLLTSRTTRGVLRRPRPGAHGTTPSSPVPRWG